MHIQHVIQGHKGSFFYESAGKKLAESTFSLAPPNRMIVDHTQVDESLKGQGAGLELVKAAVAYARKEKLRILPLCPFFKAMFDRHPEFSDVRD